MDVFDLFAKLSLDSSEFDSGLSSAVSAAESLGGVLTGGLATAATAGVATIAAVGTAAIGAGTALVSATADVAAYGDTIDKMSQKIGISAEAYQEWDAVLQHSGASASSLRPVMKTLANAAQTNNEAFQRLGISEEEVANLSQEDLFSRVIEELQNMEEGTERTYLATQLLGRGATEFGALLNTSAEDTQAMKDRVHELNGVMSDEAVKAAAAFQDQLQDMTTAFEGLKRSIMSDFMPSLTTVMAGLTEIFAGNYDEGLDQIAEGIDETVTNITDKLPDVLEIATGIFSALASAIGDNASTIIGTFADVVIDIVEQIAGGAPDIVNIALDVVNTLIDSISSSLPDLIPAITDGLSKALDALTSADTITKLANSAVTLMQSFTAGIIKAIPTLLKTLPTLLGNLVSGVFGAIGELMKVSSDKTSNPIIEAFQSLFSEETMNGILESIKSAITMSGDALVELGDVLLDFFTDALDEMSESDETSEGIISLVMSTIDQLFVFLEDYLPKFEQKMIPIVEKLWPTIIKLVGKMFEKVAEIVGVIAPYITQIVSGLVKVLVDSGTLQILITGWVDVFKAIVKALPDIIKPLLMSVPSIIVDLSTAFIDCIPDLIECGFEIVAAIVIAIPDIIKALVDEAPNIINALIEGFTQNDLTKKFVEMFTDVWNAVKEAFEGFVDDAVFWGADLVDNFISGIDSKIDDLKESVGEDGVTGTVRKFMHFSEPDEGPLSDFHTYAPDMMKTFAQGIRDNTSVVTDAVSDAFNFGGMITGQQSTGGGSLPGLITPTASQPVQVTLVLDKQQLGKVIFDLNKQESRRMGVNLANV